ncbi:MAG: hypothetical protein AB1742_11625 [bacterium]
MEVNLQNQSNYLYQIVSRAVSVQGDVLLRLFDVAKQVEAAVAKPLANLSNVGAVDTYA